MTLSNLPPQQNLANMTRTEKISAMHLSLSSILSSIFMMKMEWVTSRGLPCGGYSQVMRIQRLHSRLVTSWQALTCMFLRSIPVQEVNYLTTELQSNLARVLNTHTPMYTICQMRSTRDCVLLDKAQEVVESLVML